MKREGNIVVIKGSSGGLVQVTEFSMSNSSPDIYLLTISQ